jgi:hypothetical protein
LQDSGTGIRLAGERRNLATGTFWHCRLPGWHFWYAQGTHGRGKGIAADVPPFLDPAYDIFFPSGDDPRGKVWISLANSTA